MMGATKSPQRVPLGGLDLNRRNTPVSSANPTGLAKVGVENAVLGKRVFRDDGENGIAMKEMGPGKRRKFGVHIPGGEDEKETLYDELPTIEINDCESKEAEKEKDQGGSQVITTRRNSSPISPSLESSQQTTIPLNSQDTNITEPDRDGSDRGQISLVDAKQQAHALRLRLKMAMYKVHTNQTSVPLSRLEIRSGSFSSSLKNNWSKRSLSTYPPSTLDTGLSVKSNGEALFVGGGEIGVAPTSFRESVSMPIPRQSYMNSSFRSKLELPQQARYRGGVDYCPHAHAHPKPEPYARQKRRTSSSSLSGSSDIEMDVLLSRNMSSKRREGAGYVRLGSGSSRALERGDYFDQGLAREGRSAVVSRNLDNGFPGRRTSSSYGDGGNGRGINAIRSRKSRDGIQKHMDESGDGTRNMNERADDRDELDVAAGGLLELMSQGRSKAP